MWRGKSEVKVRLKKNDKIYYFTPNNVGCYSWLVLAENKNLIFNLIIDDNIIRFTYKNNNLILLTTEFGNIDETFIKEDYKFLNVNNEVVIDIGASIGDSPIYFALNNAKRVIALEPYPYAYNLALKNIKLNNLEDKIILLNAGYGYGIKSIKVDPEFKSTVGSSLINFNKGIDIPILSLKDIFEIYNIDNAIVKIDCEGCEYNLIKEDPDTLRKIKMIQIEYHYGYKELKDKLEEVGFRVEIRKPIFSFNRYATKPEMYIGYIYATH